MLPSFARMFLRMDFMSRCRMGVMCGLLMGTTLLVFGRFIVMTGCVGVVFRSFAMVLCCLFGHLLPFRNWSSLKSAVTCCAPFCAAHSGITPRRRKVPCHWKNFGIVVCHPNVIQCRTFPRAPDLTELETRSERIHVVFERTHVRHRRR